MGVPQVADAHQAVAVHLQDAVSQRQPAIGRCRAAWEQGLDVETGGPQGRVLWRVQRLRAPWAPAGGWPQAQPPRPTLSGEAQPSPGHQCVCRPALDPVTVLTGPGHTPRSEDRVSSRLGVAPTWGPFPSLTFHRDAPAKSLAPSCALGVFCNQEPSQGPLTIPSIRPIPSPEGPRSSSTRKM